MTHPLVEQLRFARYEWRRGLRGVPEADETVEVDVQARLGRGRGGLRDLCPERLDQSLEAPDERGHDELVLVAEVVVEGAVRDGRPPGDVAGGDRRGLPLGEERLGGVEEPAPELLRAMGAKVRPVAAASATWLLTAWLLVRWLKWVGCVARGR